MHWLAMLADLAHGVGVKQIEFIPTERGMNRAWAVEPRGQKDGEPIRRLRHTHCHVGSGGCGERQRSTPLGKLRAGCKVLDRERGQTSR
jgi:hypothetical protein